jgi:hypothetical protein
MLANTLPLLPFHHTVLAKKEWVNNKQEKKGRVIDLQELKDSFEYEEDEESEEEVSSEESESLASTESWDSNYEDGRNPYGDDFDWAGHIDRLLPDKAELGKPPPKLYKKPEVVRRKKNGPGLWGRAKIAFNAWKEKEKQRRKHYIYKEYEEKIKAYDEKIREDILAEIAKHRLDVMKEVAASRKRLKTNSMEKKSAKVGDLSGHETKVKQYDREMEIVDFYCTNLQRWAVEKHQQKIDMEEMKRVEIAEREAKQKHEREEAERERAKIEDAKELQMDLEITKKIAEYGRKIGVLAGSNVYDIHAANLAKEAKAKKKAAKADFRQVDKNPVLVLRLHPDTDFKLMRRNGIGPDGKRMRVFDYPDMTKTRHVTTLRCVEIGERGALSLAADFVRGACPLVEELDMSRCQIQSRGLGRLLHGMKVGNLMSLHRFVLRGNSITARGLQYLQESFLGGTFPALVELDLRENEWGDNGLNVLIDMIQRKLFYTVTHLRLQNNGISDVGFSRLVRIMQSTQEQRMPYVESINLENNPISGEVKRQFSPLPYYFSI